MKSLGLVSCTKKKQDFACKASEMYSDSDLFRKAYDYATKNYDFVVILSAKYGLLLPDDKIDPYNLTLNEMTCNEVAEWSERVFKQMKDRLQLSEIDKAFFHTGARYRQHLMSRLESIKIQCEAPLRNLGIDQQKKWYLDHDRVRKNEVV